MTIKETAGRILLYLYQLQRTSPASMQSRQLGFINKPDDRLALTSDKKWLTHDLLDLGSQVSGVFNGFTFLIDKGYIRAEERANKDARIYVGIRLTADGIDVVESVEMGNAGREMFAATFNIATDSGTNVETLIKANVTDLLK